ncbi:methyltransferase domain-containing protein [Actinomycetospora lutea]|uniref:methyltransferase domain-containing protein n=1 Tax=Actinomycetospora lutea TaxID=663604 RepID=UPI0023663E0A|nr:methyltransferase domain-containing protein [Actinomycetospora lutea]MDD7942727.1 methyltransferase domain-containing protein [Actinomycetospora lutea]
MTTVEGGYALRLSDDELTRYRLAAQRAREQEADLWELAGLRPGARVVDVGCGPGAMLPVLAEVVGPHGAVAGVDADPEAVATARSVLARAGVHRAGVRRGRAEATGLPGGSFDVAMVRHVLAHNGGAEQRIVEHLASLVHPGGHVYLLDVDAAAFGVTPALPEIEDMTERYTRWHADRGNDVRVGRRLAVLARGAGLEVEAFRGWFEIEPLPVGMRGPAWAARDTLVAAGLADTADVARWDAAAAAMDAWPERPELIMAMFAVVARRPGQAS